MITNPIASSRRRLSGGHFLAALIVTALISPAILAAPTQQAYLKASNARAFDNFGGSAAVSGDTVVVGSPEEDSSATGVNGDQSNTNALSSGAAYVFVRNGTNWIQQAYLKASNTGVGDYFGRAVAVSGDTIVVGALFESSNATGVNGDQSNNGARYSGAAYIFTRDGTNWTQQAYLKASNTDAEDYFGWSVAASGDTVVVGAYQESSNATGVNGDQSDNSAKFSGAAYVFVRDGTNWSEQAYLKASNAEAYDAFGFSVAVSGNTLVVGAPEELSNATGVNGNQSDNSEPGAGAAYIFVRDGTNWSQQAYLKDSGTETFQQIGYSVAASGDTVVIGALVRSIYVFVRNGTNWAQQVYLEETGDHFGTAVSVSGETAVAGAPGEDSNATGVNGNQNDNSATDAGAAYVFGGLGLGTMMAIVPDGSGGYFIRFKGIPELTYRLQRAADLSGPWPAIATNTAPPSGLLEFHDTTPLAGQAFYRTVQP